MKSKWVILGLLIGGVILFALKEKIMAKTAMPEEPREDKIPPTPVTKAPPTPTAPTLSPEEKILKAKIELALLPYKAHFQDAASKLGVDINLVRAEVFRESSGNPDARRWEEKEGEYSIGLGGLLLSTARGMGFRGTQDELFDPRTNIFYTAEYLKFWYGKTGDLALSTSCYNGGYRALNYYKDNDKFLNPTHVNAVMKYYRLLKA